MLNNVEVASERKNNRIIITPFKQENLGTNSYDLTLGPYYFREQRPELGEISWFNPYSERSVREVWGWHNHAEAARFVIPANVDMHNIDMEAPVIVLEPGETILAHTEEFIGGLDFITTKMYARSTLGRSFIQVCKCAGLGDIGYVNRWTMEITNCSRWHPLPLLVGHRIAQMTFDLTGHLSTEMPLDYSKLDNSKYQGDLHISKLIESWHPDMMLPRAFADREFR